MAASRILMVLIVLCYVLVGISTGAEVGDAFGEAEGSHPSLKPENEQLRLRISSLESGVSARTNELKRKDEVIQQLEKIIQERSASIESLQTEMESILKRRAIDAQRMLGKAETRARELEDQIDVLMNEIRMQTKESEDFEARAARAEKELHAHSLKLESLEKTNEEQCCRAQEAEHELEVAEEELAKAQLEAKLASSKLEEVHQAWLPIWFTSHISHCQHVATVGWNKYGKPALDFVLKKASNKLMQVQRWMEPYFKTARRKWIPAVQEWLMIFETHIGHHMQSLINKLVEAYVKCKSIIVPHVVKLQELADPYLQGAKKCWEHYINWIASIIKPHVDKLHLFFKPYTKLLVCAYNKFFESVTIYHLQVQAVIQETLERYEESKPLATKDLVWFMAAALLALPTLFLYRLFSAFFCKNGRIRQSTTTSRA